LPSLQGDEERDRRRQARAVEMAEKKKLRTEATIRTARSVMAALIAEEKDYHRKELEHEIRTAEMGARIRAAREAYEKRLGELRDSSPAEAERQAAIIAAYKKKREETESEAALAELFRSAESKKVRTTAEAAAQARERMLETRRNLPQGEGVLFPLARTMFEHLNHYLEYKEQTAPQNAERQQQRRLKEEAVDRLPDELDRQFFEKHERISMEVEFKRIQVRNAKTNEMDGIQELEGTDYATEQREFDERLAREPKIMVTKPGGRWLLELEW
jgi:hypothetical protein